MSTENLGSKLVTSGVCVARGGGGWVTMLVLTGCLPVSAICRCLGLFLYCLEDLPSNEKVSAGRMKLTLMVHFQVATNDGKEKLYIQEKQRLTLIFN